MHHKNLNPQDTRPQNEPMLAKFIREHNKLCASVLITVGLFISPILWKATLYVGGDYLTTRTNAGDALSQIKTINDKVNELATKKSVEDVKASVDNLVLRLDRILPMEGSRVAQSNRVGRETP